MDAKTKPLNPADWGIDLTRLSHTYIIEGSTTDQVQDAAEDLAAWILCESDADRPCGSCSACLLTQSSNNPDLSTLRVPADKKSIGVDEARAMIQDVYIKPFRSRYKVYIIAADKLTEQGQNTMLKVLEEPPAYAVFILCVANPEAILATIHSRASHIRLKAAQSGDTNAYIVKNYPDYSASANFIATFCGGVTGKAVSLCESGAMELRRQMIALLCKIMDRRPSDMFLVSAFFATDEAKAQIPLLLEFAQLFFRDALTFSVTGNTKLLINTDYTKEIVNLSGSFTPKALAHSLQACETARQMAGRYVNNKALILNMLIKIWENGDFE